MKKRLIEAIFSFCGSFFMLASLLIVSSIQSSVPAQDITHNAEILQERFGAFYSDLYNPDLNQKSFYSLLLQMYQFYNQFSDDKSTQALSGTVPVTIENALQNGSGAYFLMAFEDTSYPMMLLQKYKSFLIQYVQGKFKQLNENFYASDTAQNFIPFNAEQSQNGELFKLDQSWENIEHIVQQAFATAQAVSKKNTSNPTGMQDWIQAKQIELTTLLNDYQNIRNSTLITWFFNLVTTLSTVYNSKTITLKKYNFEKVVDVTALQAYEKLFYDALDKFVTGNQDYTLGHFVFKTPTSTQIVTDKSATIFTDVTTFKNALKNYIALQLGTMNAFLAELELEKAVQVCQGKGVAEAVKQVSPGYSQYVKPTVPASIAVVTPTNADIKSPFATAAIVQSPGIQLLQKDFLNITADLQALLTSFAFDGKNVVKSTITPIVVKNSGTVSLSTAFVPGSQQQLLQNFSTVFNNKSTVTSKDALILNSLAVASNWYQQVVTYYQKANQPLLLQSYTDYQKYILAILALFKQGSDAYQASLNAPQFAKDGSTEKTEGSYLLDAKNFFNQIASIFELLHKPDLVIYAKRLASQAAIKAYQSSTQGYVNYYKQWITAYVEYALQTPVLGDINTVSNGLTVDLLQQYLTIIFGYLDRVLDPAIQDYQQELSFYLSLDQTNQDVQLSVTQLQAALQVLQNLEKALRGIYHCLEDEKGNNICDVSGDIKTIIEKCSDDDSDKCFGADNYIEALIKNNTSLIEWILFSNKKYFEAQEFFAKIDNLFKKYPQVTQDYTQINSLFQSNKNTLTYTQFFYLHQARLYMTLGQKLQVGKDLGASDTFIVTFILYLFAQSLYEQGGFSQQASAVADIVKKLSTDYLGQGQKIYDRAKSLIEYINPEKVLVIDPPFFLNISNLVFLYFLTAIRLGGFPRDGAFFEFITNKWDICSTSPLAKTSIEAKGYLQYITNHSDSIFFPDLMKLFACYLGYLVEVKIGKVKNKSESCFFQKAQQFLNNAYTNYDQLLKNISIDLKNVTNKDYYQETCGLFLKLLNLQKALKKIRNDCYLYRFFFQQTTEDLNWKDIPEDINQLLGDFHKKTADALLAQEKNKFSNSSLLVDFDINVFKDITQKYELAADCYTKSDSQKDFIAAKLGITDTVAFQSYSSVVPVYNFSVSEFKLKTDSNQIVSVPVNSQSFDTILATYVPDTPLYVLRYNEEIVPKDRERDVSGDLMFGLKDQKILKSAIDFVAVPLYKQFLQAKVPQGVDSDAYANEYQKRLDLSTKKGFVISGKTMFTTLNFEKQKDSSYIMTIQKFPIVPLPRFANEPKTAYGLYNSIYPLYANGTDPLAYDQKILFPLHDPTQKAMIQSSMLNTYFAQALSIWSKIKQLQLTDQYKALDKLSKNQMSLDMNIDLYTRFQYSFSHCSDLYQNIQNLFIDLFATYGSLLDFISAYGEESALAEVYKLYAQAYAQQIQINSLFFVDSPLTSSYKSMAQLSCNYANQVAYYSNSLSQNLNLAVPAILTAIRPLEEAADFCATQKIDPEVTYYPSSNTVYPKPVPGFDVLYNYKDAWRLYLIVEQQLVNFLQLDVNSGQSFPDVQVKLTTIRAKILKMLTQLGSYYLARFGYNAYQQLLCDLTPDGQKATYTEKITGVLAADTNKAYTPEKIWKMENVLQVGIDPNHPSYLYPVVGSYPQVILQKDQFGNTLYNSSTTGVVFSLLPQDATSTVYQGVASVQQPLFQTLLKSGQVGSQQASITNFMAGSTVGAQNDNLAKAYNLMKSDLLNAIYYYGQTIAIAGSLIPASVNRSSDISPTDIIPTAYMANIFSKAPAFALTTSPTAKLPVISVQGVEQSGTAKFTRFYEIQNFTNQNFAQWHPLSFSNAQQIYPQTLQYWASQPTFGPDICNQCLKWIDSAVAATNGLLKAQFFSIASSWITNLHYLARNFYWQAYLPGIDYQTAQTDLNAVISQMNDKQFIQEQEYIG